MAETGMFGKKIPRIGDIVKIDGKKLVDKDGDEFSRSEIAINADLGGGWERASVEDDE